MLGLILKDLFTIRLYAKQLLILLVFFIVISLGLDNAPLFLGAMFAMLFMMMNIYTFSYDAICKWDRYAQTLPVTKKEIVISKYILALLLCVVGIILAFCLTSIFLQWQPMDDFTMQAQLITYGLYFCVMILFNALLLPFVFRFGVERARLIIIALVAIPGVAFALLSQFDISLPGEETLLFLGKLLPVIVLVIFILSNLLSVKIYEKKEI